MIDVAISTARVAASPLSSSVHPLHHRHANAWLKTLHLHSTIAITVNTDLGWPQLGLKTTVAVREGALLEDVFFFLAPISSELAGRMDAAHERADRQVPLNYRMSFHLAQGKMQGEDIGGDYVGCGVGRLLNVSTPSNCGQCMLWEAYGPAQLRVKCCLGSQHCCLEECCGSDCEPHRLFPLEQSSLQTTGKDTVRCPLPTECPGSRYSFASRT